MAGDWAERALALSQDERFDDFIIACDGHEFKVNRLMISSHSRYFEKLLNSWTVVSRRTGSSTSQIDASPDTQTTDTHQESQEGRVTMQEDDICAMKSMIHYFKTAVYRLTTAASRGDTASLLRRDLINFVVADKYEVVGMQEQIYSHFQQELDLLGKITLKQVLTDITRDIYITGFSHQMFRKIVKDKWVELLHFGAGVNAPEEDLTEILSSVPEFGNDLIRELVKPRARALRST